MEATGRSSVGADGRRCCVVAAAGEGIPSGCPDAIMVDELVDPLLPEAWCADRRVPNLLSHGNASRIALWLSVHLRDVDQTFLVAPVRAARFHCHDQVHRATAGQAGCAAVDRSPLERKRRSIQKGGASR